MKDKLCVALDGMLQGEALELCREIREDVGWAKVGMELFTGWGPQVVQAIRGQGMRVFLDLKFHDIPKTVHNAVFTASQMGVSLCNVHAAGGLEMLKAAKEGASKSKCDMKVIAVTLLTSINAEILNSDLKVRRILAPSDYVTAMMGLARSAGLDGVVCSPLEVAQVKDDWRGSFAVTPGIRLPDQSADDQQRIATPKLALKDGSDLLVIGRAITKASDPVAALKLINENING